MEPQRPYPHARKKKLIWGYLSVNVFFMSVFWGLFLLRWLGDYDLLKHHISSKINAGLTTYAIIAIAGSLIVALGTCIEGRRTMYMAVYGVERFARVTKVGRIAYHDMVTMKYSYEYARESYQGSCDLAVEEARAMQRASNIKILIDPNKPRRSALYVKVLPQGPEE